MKVAALGADRREGETGVSERQESDLPSPFPRLAFGGDENQVVDHRADREIRPDREQACDVPSCVEPPVRVVTHGREIVGQKSSVLLLGPFEESGIVRSANRGDILSADQIHIGDSPPQSTDDPAIEVLVGEKANHSSAATALETLANALAGKAPFHFPASLLL